VAVGILSTYDFQLLRWDAGDACEVVGEGFGDGSGGDVVCLGTRLEAIELSHFAADDDAFWAHERTGVG